MGSTTPSGIELRDSDEDNGLDFDIGQGYVLELRYHEDSIRLRVEHEERGEWYVEDVARDFFESRQKRQTIANEIARRTSADAQWMKDRFRDVKMVVDEAEKMAIADDARDVLERTEDVRAYQTPEKLSVVVWLEAPEDSRVSETRRLSFDGVEFESKEASDLQQKHFRAFLARLRIADEDWQVIRDEWLDELSLDQSETRSEDDVIADRVSDVLAKRVSTKVFDAEEPLLNSDTAAHYETASESQYDEATVWVQSAAIQQVIESETTKSPAAYISTLSSTLKRRAVTLDSSCRRRIGDSRVPLYPFSADALGISEMDVQSPEQPDEQDGDDSEDSSGEIER